jgi:hypothetical protein
MQIDLEGKRAAFVTRDGKGLGVLDLRSGSEEIVLDTGSGFGVSTTFDRAGFLDDGTPVGVTEEGKVMDASGELVNSGDPVPYSWDGKSGRCLADVINSLRYYCGLSSPPDYAMTDNATVEVVNGVDQPLPGCYRVVDVLHEGSIACAAERPQGFQLLRLQPDSWASSEVTPVTDMQFWRAALSPDGKVLAFGGVRGGTSVDIYSVALDGTDTPEELVTGLGITGLQLQFTGTAY